jgi:WD40 repeat protein
MAVQLWDLGAGVERRRLTGPQESLVCVALAADGRNVAAGDRNGTIHLWVLDPPGTPPRSFAGHLGAVTGLVFEADGALLSVGLDGTLRRWDFGSNKGRLLRADAGSLRGIALSRAIGCVALAGDRLLIRCPDSSVVATDGHAGGTRCVAFSADGAFLASGGADGAVRLWRTSDGGALVSFEGHEGPVQTVAVSPDRRFVYSGGADGTLRRWAIRSAALSARAP